MSVKLLCVGRRKLKSEDATRAYLTEQRRKGVVGVFLTKQGVDVAVWRASQADAVLSRSKDAQYN